MTKRRTPEQWQTLFAKYQDSGLTQAEFCRQQDVCPKYFSRRRQQLLSDQGTLPVSRFIQVKSPENASAAAVSLHYQGIVIRFAQADARFIAEVARSLT